MLRAATVGTKRMLWRDLEGQINVVDVGTGTKGQKLDVDRWLLGEEVASSVGSVASGVVAKRLNHPHAVSLSVDQLLSELDAVSVVSVVGIAVVSLREALAVVDEEFHLVGSVDHATIRNDDPELRQLGSDIVWVLRGLHLQIERQQC
jgi:hypothetical protein